MRKLILFIAASFCSLIVNADTWALIGKGFYEDPLWYWSSNNEPVSGYVDIEECIERPGVYRFKSRLSNSVDDYIYINCEKKNHVYVSEYSAYNTANVLMTVSQRCSENGWKSSSYGILSLSDRTVTIPGDYFCYTAQSSSPWSTCSSERKFVFRLPSEGDASMISGIYFGITAFNHLPKFKAIQLLDESNRIQYHNFVNSQEPDEYTYLYYSVDKALSALTGYIYPKDAEQRRHYNIYRWQ